MPASKHITKPEFSPSRPQILWKYLHIMRKQFHIIPIRTDCYWH